MNGAQQEHLSSTDVVGAQETLICPFCPSGRIIVADDRTVDGWLTCPSCGYALGLEQAVTAVTYLHNAEESRRFADQAEVAADQWEEAADRVWAELIESALPPLAPESMLPLASDRESASRSGVPTATLLQGTGAIMILAAMILVTAVAWTVLPAAGQALLLIVMVGLLGVITVATQPRVPTTSTILAILTIAVYAVVAVGIPVLLTVDSRWYPTAAALVGSLALLAAGGWAGVAVWRHAGVAALPLVAVFLTAALLDPLTNVVPAWSLAAVLLAIQASALLWVAVRQYRSDIETAVTSLWSGMSLTAFATVAALVAVAQYLMAVPAVSLSDRLWAALALVACGLVMTRTAFSWSRSKTADMPRVEMWGAPAVGLALPVAVTPLVSDSPLTSFLPAIMLTVVLTVGTIVYRSSVVVSLAGRVAVAVMVAASAATAAWLLLLEVVTVDSGEWRWLTYLAVAGVIGVGMVAAGLRWQVMSWSVSGWTLLVTAWTTAWIFEHLGESLAALTLPLAGVSLVCGTVIQRRFAPYRRRTLWRQGVVIAAATPLFIESWWGFVDDGTVPWRSLAVSAALVATGWLLSKDSRGKWTMTTSALAVGALFYGEAALGRASVGVVEPYFALFAVAVVAVVTVAWWEGLIRRWYAGLVAGLAIVAAPATLIALYDPPLDFAYASERAIGLLTLYTGITVANLRRHPAIAAGAGTTGLILVMEWYGAWLAESRWGDVPEMWAIPLAVGATVAIWLWLAAAGTTSPSQRWGWLASPAVVALLVSTWVSLPPGRDTEATSDTVRVVIVLVIWWSLAMVTWRWRGVFSVVLPIAALVTYLQLVAVMEGAYESAGVEVYTWTAAGFVAATTALLVKRLSAQWGTLITLAPTLALTLIPTALLASVGSEGFGWRGWLVLIASGAALTVGVYRKWAGAILPSLIAIGIIVVPIVTRLTADLPAWIPLAVVGAILLIIGARLEALRRGGRSLAHWAATLR